MGKRRQQVKTSHCPRADKKFCADWDALEVGGWRLTYHPSVLFMTFSSIIMENRSEDMVIELKQAKVFQRATREISFGKRLQPMCKGWNQS